MKELILRKLSFGVATTSMNRVDIQYVLSNQ